jgi:hypothetical protein
MPVVKKDGYMCCSKPAPKSDLKSSLELFTAIEKISVDDIEKMKVQPNEIHSSLTMSKVRKNPKKYTNPSSSFLALGEPEIAQRYRVNLALKEVEYCKKHSLIAFTSDTSIAMVHKPESADKRILMHYDLLEKKEREMRPGGERYVNDLSCLKVGVLNRRHMLLGFNDGNVKVIDTDRPRSILLEAKFQGGKVVDMFFTSAMYGVLTVTVEDGRVWIQKVFFDPSEDGKYDTCNVAPVEIRSACKDLLNPELL